MIGYSVQAGRAQIENLLDPGWIPGGQPGADDFGLWDCALNPLKCVLKKSTVLKGRHSSLRALVVGEKRFAIEIPDDAQRLELHEIGGEAAFVKAKP